MRRICLFLVPLLILGIDPGRAQAAHFALGPSSGERGVTTRDTVVLNFADAQHLALANDRHLRAIRAEREVALGRLRQASLITFNPELEIRDADLARRGELPRGSEYEIVLEQEVEWAGQRSLRMRTARSELGRTEAEIAEQERRTLREVALSFSAASAAETRLRLLEELLGRSERLRAASQLQFKAGEISRFEANLVEMELGRSRARLLGARREANAQRLTLYEKLGIPADQRVRIGRFDQDLPSPQDLGADSLISLALDRRPDVLAASWAVEEAALRGRLVGREALPTLNLGLIAGRNERGREADVGFGLRLSLPVLNRNQGLRAIEQARTEQAQYTREAIELSIRIEVEHAVRTYLSAFEEVEVLEREILEPARENQEMLEIAFRSGKIDLPTLLLVHNQLVEAELEYWDASLLLWQGWIELQAAIAAPLREDR